MSYDILKNFLFYFWKQCIFCNIILKIHHKNFHYVCTTFCVPTLCILTCFSFFLFSNSSALFLKIEFSPICEVYDFLFQNSRTPKLLNEKIKNKKDCWVPDCESLNIELPLHKSDLFWKTCYSDPCLNYRGL